MLLSLPPSRTATLQKHHIGSSTIVKTILPSTKRSIHYFLYLNIIVARSCVFLSIRSCILQRAAATIILSNNPSSQWNTRREKKLNNCTKRKLKKSFCAVAVWYGMVLVYTWNAMFALNLCTNSHVGSHCFFSLDFCTKYILISQNSK